MNASKRIFAIAALIAPVLLAACADAPTEPQLQPAITGSRDYSTQLELVAAPDARSTDRVTRTIGSSGGIIAANGVTLVIPAGALERDVAITMTVTTGTQTVVSLEPHGLALQRAAELSYTRLGTTGITGDGMVQLLESTPALGVWELLEYTLSSKGLILVGG